MASAVDGRSRRAIPVHSVLFLILAFFNAAGLFVLIGAEFLAMILVIVYVGAVAVLFLFVVMMLDINFAELRAGLPAVSAGRRADRRRAVRWSCCSVLGSWAASPAALAGAARRRSAADASHQHPCARPLPLYRLHLSVPGGGHDPAGRDDRRDRADPAPARGRAPPVASPRSSRAPRRERSRCVKVPTRGRGSRMMTIGLAHYLTVAAILFTLGIFGIFLNRKNVIIILMSIELMLLAVNINLVRSRSSWATWSARSSPCSC